MPEHVVTNIVGGGIGVTIVNCIFANSTAERGSAIMIHDGRVRVTRSAFRGNRALSETGGAAYVSGGVLIIEMSTLAGNVDGGLSSVGKSAVVVLRDTLLTDNWLSGYA